MRNNNILGSCFSHCYKQNSLYVLLIILFSITIGIIIGINLGIMIKSKGVAFNIDFSLENNNSSPSDKLANDINKNNY